MVDLYARLNARTRNLIRNLYEYMVSPIIRFKKNISNYMNTRYFLSLILEKVQDKTTSK
jgi:hypothetical protein